MQRKILIMALAAAAWPMSAMAQTAADGGPLLDSARAAETEPAAPPAGTAWTTALGYDFRRVSDGQTLASNPTLGTFWCVAPSSLEYAYARLDIPKFRKIRYFRLWGQDFSSTKNVSAILRRVCLPDTAAAANPVQTTLATVSSNGSPGGFTVNATIDPPVEVDSGQCTYWAYVYMPGCTNLSVRKVFVEHTE